VGKKIDKSATPKEEKLWEFPLGQREMDKRRATAKKAFQSGIIEDLRDEAIKKGDARWRIIRYQRIVDPRRVPMRLSLDSFTTPETFEKHLEYLAANCKPMALGELIRRIDEYEDIPDKTVAVTFDGGHMDNYLYAFPRLLKYQVPATVFPVTGYLQSNAFFFEDRIALALEALEKHKIPLPRVEFVDESVYEAIEQVSPDLLVNDKVLAIFVHGLRSITEEQRIEVMAALAGLLADITEPPDYEDFMRWDDVKHMAKLGYTFGLMGHTDIVATAVSADRFLEDMIAANEVMASQGIKVERVYAFPQGLFSETALDLLEKLHVRYALALGVIPEPKYQARLPMLLGRVSMCELSAFTREVFACRLWSLKVSGIDF
jgi:peptidoglycan/xylan/chitin deacetylase (PgdA/CDA1 family)